MNETITTPPKEPGPLFSGKQRRGNRGRTRDALRARFSRMLLATAAFLILSIFALDDFSSFPSLPEDIRKLLGTPPSPNMINTALIVYSFSAILLILSRMMGGYGAYGGIIHVGYLAAFYGFYHFAGVLDENFWAVFAAGMTILGLETYHVWIYCVEHMKGEGHVLEEDEKKEGGDRTEK